MITPIGAIIMWSGLLANIPTGWYLCDGSAHDGKTTPDLRGHFIYGASADGDVGQTNAAPTHVHTRPATSGAAGAHSHAVVFDASGNTGTTNSAGSGPAGQDIAEENHGHASGNGSISEVDHTHSVGGNTDGTTPLPPYLMLYFIMRTS